MKKIIVIASLFLAFSFNAKTILKSKKQPIKIMHPSNLIVFVFIITK